EVLVRFAPRALVGVVDVQSAEQAAAGPARGGVDDDPRTLRRAGPRDRRPGEPLSPGRPRSRPPHGPPAPRARRTLLRRGL
ncbi:MAG: hypothetical protein AVDCRST_MAG80-213, partial [uncultured Rubrobacteraceae bacterium]